MFSTHLRFNILCQTKLRTLRRERGETLLTFLVAMALSLVVVSGAVSLFLDSTRRGFDTAQINQAEDEARAVLELLVFDLRMTGSGMPLGQEEFAIGDVTLGDAPLPLLPSSNGATVTVRLNERGHAATLLSDYNPSSHPSLILSDTSSFDQGDTIALSDMPVGGTGGLIGTVSGVSAQSITLAPSPISSPLTTFSAGSALERVSTVTYDAPDDWSGITRDDGSGAVLLSPNSRLQIEYFDTTGTALPLPLTESAIRDSLASLQVTVSVRSTAPLKGRSFYTATVSQRVSLRNLILSRTT